MSYIAVITTLPDEKRAREMARGVVEARLAGCVQIDRIESTYRWKGNVENEPEWRLMIKTRAELYSKLEEYLLSHHTYEVPEVIALPLTNLSAAYGSWLDEVTG
jgi:periplasmic divalent cation tolerance protein